MPQRDGRASRTPTLSHLTDFVAVFVTASTLFLAAWATVPAALSAVSGTVVMSGSMAPGIRPGDVVLTAPVVPTDVVPGAVVLFRDLRDPDRQLLHRIERTHDDGSIVTRGDANTRPDPGRLTIDDLEGIGRILVPYAGRPGLWLRTGDAIALTAWLVITCPLVVRVGRRWPLLAEPVAVRPARRPRRSAARLLIATLVCLALLPAADAALTATTTTPAAFATAVLQPPIDVAATCLPLGGVEVSWRATGTAVPTGFEVRRQAGDGAWEIVGTSSSTTYTDATAIGADLRYQVRSTLAGWSSTWSASSDSVNAAVLGVCL